MNKIVVAGGSGLIGSAAVDYFSNVRPLVKVGRKRGVNDLYADLALPETFERLQVDDAETLIHCAGVVDEDLIKGPELVFRQALLGTEALLQFAIRSRVRKVVLVSSAHVYGPMAGRKNEESVSNPQSNYAIAHFAAEQVFRRLASHFDSVAVFRPCAVYGNLPDMSTFRRWGLIPFSFPRAAMLEGRISLRSSGEQRRNFVGAKDIAVSVSKWIDGDFKGFGIYNPIGVANMSVWNFAELCADRAYQLFGKKVVLERVFGESSEPQFDYESKYDFCLGTEDICGHVDRFLGYFCDTKSA